MKRNADYGLITAPILGGVERLADEPMVVNGQLVAASVQLVGADGNATAKTITCRASGDTLVEAGSGASPTFGVSGPGRPGECKGIEFAAAKILQSTDADHGDVATEDIVAEVVWLHVGAGVQYIGGTYPSKGWLIYENGATINFYINDGTSKVCAGAPIAGTVNHAIGFLDRSGSGIVYLNNVAGSAVDISGSPGSLISSTNLYIGGNGANLWSGTLFYFAMHKKASWLASHLNPTVAAHRFSIFSHYLAAHGHASLVPTLPTRTSAAYTRGF